MSRLRAASASTSAKASADRSASQGHLDASGASAGQADLPSARACNATDVAIAAQLACLLEVSAPKPGNISPGRAFHDLRYEDFLAGAAAIGAPLAAAGSQPLGVTIRTAIETTARWTRSNTNLGIVLLLAPLAKAAVRLPPSPLRGFGETGKADTAREDVVSGFSPTLRDETRRVLDGTTVDDAREVYVAIRRAAPGGLGKVADQDVADEPTLRLLEVMRLAADRDSIAREYATTFELTFVTGVPALERARRDGLSWDDAVVETFLTLLASTEDTHIARRGGTAIAADVSRQARAAIAAGGVRSSEGREAIERMDRGLGDARHIGNPGTTADLTAASIFVALLAGAWRP